MHILGVIVLFILVAAIGTLFAGLIWWVGLGILAHIFNVQQLAIDYWPSVAVAFIVNILLGGLIRNRQSS